MKRETHLPCRDDSDLIGLRSDLCCDGTACDDSGATTWTFYVACLLEKTLHVWAMKVVKVRRALRLRVVKTVLGYPLDNRTMGTGNRGMPLSGYRSPSSSGGVDSPFTQSAPCPVLNSSTPMEVDGLCEDTEMLVDVLLCLFLASLYLYWRRFIGKQPVYDDPCRGHTVVHKMLNGHWKPCYSTCRMYPDIFRKLCEIFRERGLLRSTRNVTVEEQMRIFLQTLAHNERNCNMQDKLHHSGETISRYFNMVLKAFCVWAPDMIRPRQSLHTVPDHVQHYGGGKYWPFFKDCVGALDGTHVSARIPRARQLAFRSGRDGKTCTQNVLAVCDFDMRFTFTAAGWEGTAHDSKVLSVAMSNPTNNFPVAPSGKYYVVDAGYPNRTGFLGPYRNTKYHIPAFQRAAARGRHEHFNQLHSSLRNVIERTFGLWKRRWAILNHMPPYSFSKQVKIVVACMTVHNFLIEQKMRDAVYREFEDEDTFEGQHGSSSESMDTNNGDENRNGNQLVDSVDMAIIRDRIRDEIAEFKNL